MSGVATFLIMFLFWVILSGMFDAFHLTLGLISCSIVTALSRELLFLGSSKQPWIRQTVGLILYLPWLFWAIVLSCIDVARIVLHPRMLDLIDPRIIHFKTQLKSDFSRVTFAQSITLTPGTITVFIHEDEFTVHALTKDSADGLPGEMEERIIKALESHS